MGTLLARTPRAAACRLVMLVSLPHSLSCARDEEQEVGGQPDAVRVPEDARALQLDGAAPGSVDGHVVPDFGPTDGTIDKDGTDVELDAHADGATRDARADQAGLGGVVCAACEGDSSCAGIGIGARCVSVGGERSGCLPRCTPPGQGPRCPTGFLCVEGGSCFPAVLFCIDCLVDGCPAGGACNASTGRCTDLRGTCEDCIRRSDCLPGHECVPVGHWQKCLRHCEEGRCPSETVCIRGLCLSPIGTCSE